MQIVIDIPDRIYKINQNRRLNITDAEILEKAVRNGTPLPKGHGRLIDADVLLDKKEDYGEGQQKLILIDPYFVRNAPTIIETDKTESEVEKC